MAKTTLRVEGMMCPVCSGKVDEALKSAEGVKEVSVDLKRGTVRVVFDETKTEPKKLIRAVLDAGYRAEIKHGFF